MGEGDGIIELLFFTWIPFTPLIWILNITVNLSTYTTNDAISGNIREWFLLEERRGEREFKFQKANIVNFDQKNITIHFCKPLLTLYNFQLSNELI